MPTTKTQLEVPAIHLNGTSRNGLKLQLEDVIENLTKTLEAMAAAAPHGRDYYVKEPGAYERARHQHEQRVDKVRTALEEYQSIYEQIAFE